jgi:hypothetical protein
VHKDDQEPKEQTNQTQRVQHHKVAAHFFDRLFDHAHPIDDPFHGEQVTVGWRRVRSRQIRQGEP